MEPKRYFLYVLFSGLAASFSAGTAFSQVRVSGTVTDEKSGEPLGGVTIRVEDSNDGTFSNNKGFYMLSTDHALPLNLILSSVGYATKTIQINESDGTSNVQLAVSEVLGDEVVVAASRVQENILSSPVSIESIGQRELITSASGDYYNLIGNLKGVNMVTSSILFSTPTTRGFAGSGNVGFNQFSDGMDNEAPGLNFSVSSVLGISPLDLDKVELLPGASSALYGAGGTNGTLIMTSKDPFEYQGLSAEVKGGIMHVNDKNHKATPYQNYALRYAKAFHNKFAFKLNVNYTKAYDWIADDETDYDAEKLTTRPGSRESDPAYDGVNIYGDENTTGANLSDIANTIIQTGQSQFETAYKGATGADPTEEQIQNFLETDPQISPFYNARQAGLVPNQFVSRTGYKEKDVVDYHAYNLKLGGELAYKITPDVKISLLGNWGKGTTVYTGSDRYSLTGFSIGQYKLQLDGRHFMVRGYTTQENSGNSFNSGIQGQLLTENAKHGAVWYPEFLGAYLQALGSGSQNPYMDARHFADRDVPQPGDVRYEQLKDSLSRLAIPFGGKFTERSSLWNYEGLYNFDDQIPFVEVQVGANFRRYHLNSKGTLFDDTPGKLTSDQAGGFLQATRKLWEERIKLTGALRYDKMEHFKGKWTPRIAVVYEFVPKNNLRISYQTGYQMPTNQQQYINLDVQRVRLLGGLKSLFDKYHLDTNPGYKLDNVTGAFASKLTQTMDAVEAQLKALGLDQYLAFAGLAAIPQAEPLLEPYKYKDFKPETVRSFEVGYRGVLKSRLMIDAYIYLNNYKDFIGQTVLLQPKLGPQPLFDLSQLSGSLPPGTDMTQVMALASQLGIDLTNPPIVVGPQLIADDKRNVYQIYDNSEGIVKTWGWAFGVDYLFPGDFKLGANVTYNKLTNAPDAFLTEFNVPDYTVNVSLNNPRVIHNFGFGLNYHYQNGFKYEGGFAVGQVSAFNTIDLQFTYLVPKANLNFALGGTNIFNHYYQNAFGNPKVGGLYYISVGYNVK